jgi:hypothetical protein
MLRMCPLAQACQTGGPLPCFMRTDTVLELHRICPIYLAVLVITRGFKEFLVFYYVIMYISDWFWWESPKERDHSEDQGVGGRIGSEWIFGDWLGVCGLDSTGSG